MDDEEEDVPRPISQRWGTPFRELAKPHGPTTPTATPGHAHRHAPATPTATPGHAPSGSSMPCRTQDQPRRRYHGFRPHFPARFEPMEDRGERGRSRGLREPEQEEEEERREAEEEHREAQRPEEQAGVSVEATIGRKLREIGDQFDQDHVHMFLRHQREQLPVWMRLTMALYGFLFQRHPPAAPPRLQGDER